MISYLIQLTTLLLANSPSGQKQLLITFSQYSNNPLLEKIVLFLKKPFHFYLKLHIFLSNGTTRFFQASTVVKNEKH